MTMNLKVDNNKTIIDFGIGHYLVYQPLKTYIHPTCSSVNITFFQVDKSRYSTLQVYQRSYSQDGHIPPKMSDSLQRNVRQI
jgi:hypothetical protein